MRQHINENKMPIIRLNGGLRLSCFGTWAPYLWLSWINTYSLNLPAQVPWQIIYLAMTIALMAFSLPGIALDRAGKAGSKRGNPSFAIDWCCSCTMSVATAVIALAPHLGAGQAVVVIATVLGGLSLGWTYLRWGLVYSAVDLRQTVVYIFIGGIFWSILKVVLAMLPFTVCCLFVMLLPILSILMMRRAACSPLMPNTPTRRFAFGDLIAMWKVWVVILAVGLVTSTFIASGAMLPAIDRHMHAILNLCCIVVLSVTVIVLALKTSIPFDFSFLWRLLAFTLAVGLTLAALMPNAVVVTVFFSAVPGILIPVTWLTVCDIAKYSGEYRCAAVGFGLGVYSLASFSGVVINDSFSRVADIQVMSTVLLFLLFVVSVLCLEAHDPDIRRIFKDLHDSGGSLSEFSTINERCEALGRHYALTQREIEVMQMVYKGRPRAFIAEALFLSENTVKAHISHFYSKLGIHGKKELQQMVDAQNE